MKKTILLLLVILTQVLLTSYVVETYDPLTEPSSFYRSLAVTFIPYLATFFVLRNLKSTKLIVVSSLLASALVGVQFLPISPDVDKDVYRYKWDGYIYAETGNPYLEKPETFENSEISADFPYWEDMQFKDFFALYPPVSQIVFLFDHYAFGFSLTSIKLIFLVFFLLSIYLLHILGKQKNVTYSPAMLWLYAVNPLLLYEVTGTAHNDIIMVAFLITAMIFFVQSKYFRSGILLALSVGAKFVPIFLFPLLCFKQRINLNIVLLIGLSIGIVTIFLPFYLQSPESIFNSLQIYSEQWYYNPGLFWQIEKLMIKVGIEESFQLTKMYFWLGAACVAGLSVIRSKESENSYIEMTQLIIGYLLVANSVLFPWYLLWIMWLIPFVKRPWPWIMLSISFLLALAFGEESSHLIPDKQIALWGVFWISLIWSYRTSIFSFVQEVIYRKL